MTITARMARCDITDSGSAKDVAHADLVYELVDDNPQALTPSRMVPLACEVPRAAVPALQNALVQSGIVVVDDGAWPTNAIPLPLPKKVPG